MQKEQGSTSLRSIALLIAVLVNAIVLKIGFTANDKWYWTLFISIPLLLVTLGMNKQDKKEF